MFSIQHHRHNVKIAVVWRETIISNALEGTTAPSNSGSVHVITRLDGPIIVKQSGDQTAQKAETQTVRRSDRRSGGNS